MSSTEKQNVWFGVSMFLMGLVAGSVLVFASGAFNFTTGYAPTAPTGQNGQPTAPVVSATERIASIVKDLGIDSTAFTTCTASNKYNDLINKQESQGQASGVNGTPGNIILDLKSGKARLVSGARPFESFKAEIDDMLKNPRGKSKDSSVTEALNVTPVDFATEHVRGSKDTAVLAIIEYSDYQCPFCHRVHPTYKQIMDTYGDKVVWVYRHFPLSFHPDAMPYAVGAECVNELAGSEAFWTYTDAVMNQQ